MDEARAAVEERKAQCLVLIRLGPEWTYNCIREEGHDPELWHNFHIDDEGVAALGADAVAQAVKERDEANYGIVAAVDKIEQQAEEIARLRAVVSKAPGIVRYDTHGWFVCDWCGASATTFMTDKGLKCEPPFTHRPGCGLVDLEALRRTPEGHEKPPGASYGGRSGAGSGPPMPGA